MDTLRLIQDKLGSIPFDGVVISLLTYYLSPQEDKIKNTVIIGGAHWALHNYVCKIQTADNLI